MKGKSITRMPLLEGGVKRFHEHIEVSTAPPDVGEMLGRFYSKNVKK
jgi:hypothetical protein